MPGLATSADSWATCRGTTLHWCRRCLGHFDTEDVLNAHKLYCHGLDTMGQVLLLPDANRKVKFENEPYASSPFYHFSTICHHSSCLIILKPLNIRHLIHCDCRYLAKAPFVVYPDFEARVITTGQDHATRGHRSFDYESQTPCTVGYEIVSTFPQIQLWVSVPDGGGLREVVDKGAEGIRDEDDGILLRREASAVGRSARL